MSISLIIFWIGCSMINIYVLSRLFIAYGIRTIYFAFFINFIAQILLLPFAFDYRNVFAVGRNLSPIFRSLPEAAYLYVGLSTVFVLSFYLSLRLFVDRPLRRWGIVFRACNTAATSSLACSTIVAIQAALAGILIYSGVAYGGGIQDILQNAAIRPIANFWSIWSIYAIVFTVIRLYFNRTPRAAIELVITIAAAAVTGQRGVILVPIVVGAIATLTAIRSRGLIILPVLAIIVVPAALLFSNLRASFSSASSGAAYTAPALSSAEAAVFSNNFSDVRDFAWVLSTYNGQNLGGRTYIAGYTSIIPSKLWPLRKEWAFGTFTARSAHLDDEKTGGLRTGIFSEIYFNFGFFAALLSALILGLFSSHLFVSELNREKLLKLPQSRAANAFQTYVIFSAYCSFIFTPGFFSVIVSIIFVMLMLGIEFLFGKRAV